VLEHPDLVRQYWIGRPVQRQLLRGAQFGGVQRRLVRLHPEGCALPDEAQHLLPDQRADTGQFERTLIVATRGPPCRTRGVHGADARHQPAARGVVELVRSRTRTIKYSRCRTVPGDKEGKGGIFNFVTKRASCLGESSKITWTQVETGSAITWKYPSCILQGTTRSASSTRWPSPTITRQADTGTKMIHTRRNTRSTIISKASRPGTVRTRTRDGEDLKEGPGGAQLLGSATLALDEQHLRAHTFPYIEVKTARRARARGLDVQDRRGPAFYCRQRGIKPEDAVNMIVSGFCKEVFRELPMEFAWRRRNCSASVSKAASAEPARRTHEGTVHASDPESARPRGGKEILRGIDLDVQAGQCTPSWGRNGSGKSTRSPTSWPVVNRSRSRRAGSFTWDGTSWRCRPRSARGGSVPRLPYPVEIPGVSTLYL